MQVQALIATALDFVATAHGLGRHLFFLAPPQRVQQQFWNMVSQVFCIDSLTFCKISIGVSYLRVMRGSQHRRQGWLRGVIYVLVVVVFAVNAAVIVSLFTQCSPAAKAWDPSLPGACWAFPTALDLAVAQGCKWPAEAGDCMVLGNPDSLTASSGLGVYGFLARGHSHLLVPRSARGSQEQDCALRVDGAWNNVRHPHQSSADVHS